MGALTINPDSIVCVALEKDLHIDHDFVWFGVKDHIYSSYNRDYINNILMGVSSSRVGFNYIRGEESCGILKAYRCYCILIMILLKPYF